MIDFKSIFSDKKVLITGGLGFIGSTLTYRLVECNAQVTIIDSLIPEYGGNLFNIEGIKDKVQVNISDVRDKTSINYFVQEQDYIFNLAGTLSHIDSMLDPFTDLEINCVAQLSILEACKRYNRKVKIVFAGTRGQYGRNKTLPVTEEHLMCPIDVNGINNVAGESYHILYNHVYGIRTTSLRLTNTYGPRHQMKHPRQGVVNWFVREIMEGQRIKLYGDGAQIRDLNYVDDVVDALLLAMGHEGTNGEVYNIGGSPVSLKEAVERMIKIFGSGEYELVSFPKETKKIEIGDYIANYGKFKQATGWQPKVAMDEGLRRTFEYYQRYQRHYW